ncbi:MAG: hypothetical protein WC254_01295 [Candidatus Woesearchaeota archaeon]|jgi:hypothetical protein
MFNLINPKTEFLVVKHSHLNNLNNEFDLGRVVEEALKLEKHTNSRRIVVALEGDIIQLPDSRVILTHQSFIGPSIKRFNELREAGIAVYLPEALDAYQKFMEQYNGRVVLCLEPKPITTAKTIASAIQELQRKGITDVYFDTFFAHCLEYVTRTNQAQQTHYPTSRHLVGNLGPIPVIVDKRYPADIITVPYPMSFGSLNRPVIYGAVGDAEKLKHVAEDPQCYGAYVRFKEGHGKVLGAARLLHVSMKNTPETRKN